MGVTLCIVSRNSLSIVRRINRGVPTLLSLLIYIIIDATYLRPYLCFERYLAGAAYLTHFPHIS